MRNSCLLERQAILELCAGFSVESIHLPQGWDDMDFQRFSSLADFFAQRCDEYAGHDLFESFSVKMTYAEFSRLSHQFAAFLQQSLKLKRGDRFAIMLPNVIQFPIATYAAFLAGLTIVNVNPLYTASELAHQLSDSGATAIIVLQNFINTLESALPQTNIKSVITTGVGDCLGLKGRLINFVLKRIKKQVPAVNIVNVSYFPEVLAMGCKQTLNVVKLQPNDVAFLQYTGGTTGVAKAAILTHRNLLANIYQCYDRVQSAFCPGKDIIITALPLYHIFSLTCALFSIHVGAKLLLVTNPRDMKSFIKILRKTKFDMFPGVNTLFNALLQQKDFSKVDFSNLRLTFAGGMALQEQVAKHWQQMTGCSVTQGYGLTETSPAVAINVLDAKTFTGSVGLPLALTKISVRDDAGNVLPCGQAGELCVKGPQVMQGYWNMPEETANVFIADGWLKTGDIAKISETGEVFLLDRKKDMVIVSGFNVYPNEVEDFIMQIAGVTGVAVIGVPNEACGEMVKAFISRNDPNLTTEKVIAACRKGLTNYKVPKLIEFRQELPKSAVGKVLRRQLKEEVAGLS